MPIIVFYCDGCREPVTDRKILDNVVKLFAEHSADIWYERTAAELMPAGTKCAKCGGTDFSKESDILDVWFDSGSSHLAVLEPQSRTAVAIRYVPGGRRPVSRLVPQLAAGRGGLEGSAPYRECATNGWTLDGEGRAMSKSLGNVIEPEKVIKQYGAEVLRLWVASVEYQRGRPLLGDDPRAPERGVPQASQSRSVTLWAILRISIRRPMRVPGGSNCWRIDQWILLEAEELVRKCRAWYDEYAFHKVYRAVYDFATVDLSAVYFDVSKDRLYTAGFRSREPGAARRRRFTGSTTRWCGCLRRCWSSRPKKSGRTCGSRKAPRTASISRYSPSRRN